MKTRSLGPALLAAAAVAALSLAGCNKNNAADNATNATADTSAAAPVDTNAMSGTNAMDTNGMATNGADTNATPPG